MQGHDVDRRLFLAASAVTLLGAAGAARAQAPQAVQAPQQAPQAGKASDAGAKPTARVVDFIAGFDLKQAPALAVERARTAFIDTVGVMLAGSRSEPAGIVLELVRAEGAKPAVSIVGQSLARLAATGGAGERGCVARARLRLHLYAGPAGRADHSGAAAARRKHRRDAGRDAGGVHGRLRGRFAAEPRQPQPQRRRRLARHRHHRHDRRGGGLRPAAQAAGRGHQRRARHQRVDGRGRQCQLRHHDQAAACGAGRAQRDPGGAARRARLHRQPGGDRRPRRVRQHVCARARMAAAGVRRSRPHLRSGRARLPAQALSLRRRHPHRHRRRAHAARRARSGRGGYFRDQGRHLQIRRQPRQRAVPDQYRGGEVQSAICRRLCARERAARSVGVRRRGDQRRAGEGARAHGRRSPSTRSLPTPTRTIPPGSRSRSATGARSNSCGSMPAARGNIRCRRRRSRTSSWIARRRRWRPTRRSRSSRRCARSASRQASPNSGRCCAGAERASRNQIAGPAMSRGRRLFVQSVGEGRRSRVS